MPSDFDILFDLAESGTILRGVNADCKYHAPREIKVGLGIDGKNISIISLRTDNIVAGPYYSCTNSVNILSNEESEIKFCLDEMHTYTFKKGKPTMPKTKWTIEQNNVPDNTVGWLDLSVGDLFTIAEKGHSLNGRTLVFISHIDPFNTFRSQQIFLEVGLDGRLTKHEYMSRNTRLIKLDGTITVKVNG